jgi:hypothetical protein
MPNSSHTAATCAGAPDPQPPAAPCRTAHCSDPPLGTIAAAAAAAATAAAARSGPHLHPEHAQRLDRLRPHRGVRRARAARRGRGRAARHLRTHVAMVLRDRLHAHLRLRALVFQ